MPIFYLKKGFMGMVIKSIENDLYECKIIPPAGHKSLKYISSNKSNKDIENENLPFKINSASNGQISWFDNNNYMNNFDIMIEYLSII
jgi:hypothetical protein